MAPIVIPALNFLAAVPWTVVGMGLLKLVHVFWPEESTAAVSGDSILARAAKLAAECETPEKWQALEQQADRLVEMAGLVKEAVELRKVASRAKIIGMTGALVARPTAEAAMLAKTVNAYANRKSRPGKAKKGAE